MACCVAVMLLLSGCFLEALNLVSHVTMVHPETKNRQTCEGFSAEAVEGCVRRRVVAARADLGAGSDP